jgi:uncharacterized membrane protein
MVDTAKGKPTRGWRVILILSLALNFIVVGIVAGTAMSGRLGKGPPRAFEFGPGPLARALEPADRRALGRVLRRDGDVRRMDMRGQFTLILSSLRQDPFDPAALRGLMDEQGERFRAVQAKSSEALITRIMAMTPDERAAFADRFEHEMRRPRRSRDDRSGG